MTGNIQRCNRLIVKYFGYILLTNDMSYRTLNRTFHAHSASFNSRHCFICGLPSASVCHLLFPEKSFFIETTSTPPSGVGKIAGIVLLAICILVVVCFGIILAIKLCIKLKKERDAGLSRRLQRKASSKTLPVEI